MVATSDKQIYIYIEIEKMCQLKSTVFNNWRNMARKDRGKNINNITGSLCLKDSQKSTSCEEDINSVYVRNGSHTINGFKQRRDLLMT